MNRIFSSVDVIIPCYRYAHYLKECVESVLTQATPRVRILIIDDASPDNTAEIAAGLARVDSRVTFLRHTTNKGHIATYNEGIEWASAEYMLILSADDYLLPGALARSTSLMDANPDVGFTFGTAIVLDEHGRTGHTDSFMNRTDWPILTGLEFIELTGPNNMVPTPTAVIRTELQKRLGGYRHELPHTADMEMWLRLAAHARVGVVGECQAVYRRHDGNMSLNYITNGWLPDLQQRKSALDMFFESCSHALPNAERCRSKFYWSLGCCAVGFASIAFNMGETEVSRQLSEFALGVCPQIKRSLPWFKLSCKRRVGSRTWEALRPKVNTIRQAALRWKRV